PMWNSFEWEKFSIAPSVGVHARDLQAELHCAPHRGYKARIAGKARFLNCSDEQSDEPLALLLGYPQMPMHSDGLVESAEFVSVARWPAKFLREERGQVIGMGRERAFE